MTTLRTCRRCGSELSIAVLRPVALDWQAPYQSVVYECRDLFSCDVFANMEKVANG